MPGQPAVLAAGLLLASSLAGALPLLPPLDPPAVWSVDLGPGEATGAALDPAGRAFVAGTSAGAITVWRIDALGGVVWEARLARGIAGGLAALPDGRGVVVVGTVAGQGADGYLAALDPNGALRWTRTLATPADEALRGVAAAFDAIYAAGSFGQDLLMARVDPDGKARWTRVLDTGREEVLESALLLRDGTPVGVGWTYDGVRNRVALVHLDAFGAHENGRGWIRTLPAADGGSLRGFAGAGTAAGFVIAGEHAKAGRVAPYVATVSALGALQWQGILERQGSAARGVAADLAGGAWLAGSGAGEGAGLLERLAPTGDIAWSGAFGDDGSLARAVAAHASGLLVVAGAHDGRAVATGYADAPARVR